MSKIYYLPHATELLSANGMKIYFRKMRSKYKTKMEIVNNQSDIDDLLYYLNFHYYDDKGLKSEIDLDNCEFFVNLPPTPRNSHFCFWVRDKSTGISLHFATSESGFIPPSIEKNFRDALVAILIPYKEKIREQFAKNKGTSILAINLWHKTPMTSEIIDEFIALKGIESQLSEIVSPNGLGNNVPFFLPDYAYLEKCFLDLYFEKLASNELKYELKPVLNNIEV